MLGENSVIILYTARKQFGHL